MFVEIIENESEMGVVIDMTEVLSQDAASATRTVKLVNEKELVVADRVVASDENSVGYSWRMVTNGVPVVKKNMIVLTAEGKTMYLKANSNIKFKYTTWSAEPKADYDDPNDGKYIVGITALVPVGTMADFKVVLTPNK